MSEDLPTVKKFYRGDRIFVQAQQVWLVLAAHVQMREGTLTYGDLAELMGYDRRAGRTLARALGIVGSLCKHSDLPTLNSIVVNQETGVPGDHVVTRDGRDYRQEQKEVFRENWFMMRVPTTGAFRRIWDSIKDEDWDSD